MFAHNYLLNISLVTGDLNTAIDEWKSTSISAQMFPNISEQQRGQVEERHGILEAQYKRGTRSQFIRGLITKETNSPAYGYGNSRLLALLDDRSASLTQLENGVNGNAFGVIFIKVDPFFDSLKNEPRYKALLEKMNLPVN
jgi:hypothetical protein